jgi:hypothetical protein
MPASGLAVDWTPPWLAPYRAHGRRVQALLDAGLPCCEALDGAGQAPVRFVPQDELPRGEAYEAHIFATRMVPTRHKLHDLFNGLVWLRFPEAKRRLNELQAAEIAREGIGASRGPLRDALTLFDENGAMLDAPPALWEALLARDWQGLFVTRRSLWRDARLLVFGHALLEKLCSPRKAATAHILIAPGEIPSIAGNDTRIAAALEPAHLSGKPFTPLPVLGVPGWCVQNENFSFYDDSDVFRRRRAAEPSPTPKTLSSDAA